MPSTLSAQPPHQIKRKPPPPIEDVLSSQNLLRYPSPDPTDPLASLAQLRARKRASNITESSGTASDDDTNVIHIIHGDDDSVWYEMYPSSPIDIGYMPSQLYRDTPSPKPVSRSRSLDRGKRRSHYRPHSLTVRSTDARDPALSPPLLTSDSDDTSSESRSWENSSILSATSGIDFDHIRVNNFQPTFHDRNIPSTPQSVSNAPKHKRHNAKRSSMPPSTTSYMPNSATLTPGIENYAPRSPVTIRPHPFASSLHIRPRRNSETSQEFAVKSGVESPAVREKASSLSDFAIPPRPSYLQPPNHLLPTPNRDRRPLTPVSELPPAMKIPTVFDLSFAASCLVTAENGVSVAFGDLCTASNTIVCFIRHFWCQRSQEYIASLCRELDIETLKRGDARLVIISPGSPKIIKSYRSMFHAGLEVYCDTSLRLYDTLGMRSLEQRHTTVAKHFLIRNLLRVIRLNKDKAGNRDRLGGEFVFKGSSLRCTYARRMIAIGDHTPVSELLKVSGMGSAMIQPSSIHKTRSSKTTPSSFLRLSEPRTVTV